MKHDNARLQNYAADEWVTGTGTATTLVHAVTGEPIAEATSEGLRLRCQADHARRVGGPALRRMTFHQRAPALKEMAKYLTDRKDGLPPLGRDRRDESGFVDRHRRRHRHVLRLRQQGPPRVP